jgi:hypothetical protein
MGLANPCTMRALVLSGALREDAEKLDKSKSYAPVAQLDRVPGYEPGGREFESLRARQLTQLTACSSSADEGAFEVELTELDVDFGCMSDL